MAASDVEAEVLYAIERLAIAARNQPGNQEEILKLIKHIPAISQSIFPFNLDHEPSTNAERDACDVFQSISKYFTDKLKQLVQSPDSKYRPNQICECIENLILLSGTEYAKLKFNEVISHTTYLLIQENLEYVENVVEDFDKVSSHFISLLHEIQPLVFDIIQGLYMCETLNLTDNEHRHIVSNVILEKISTELLTIIDALKESRNKASVTMTNFAAMQSTSHEESISTKNLLLLASMIESLLSLEKCLHESAPSEIQKKRNQSDKLRKSSLKQKLPDILRSSQEASWVRSSQIYGDWDWQDVIRDIGAVIANGISKAFEEFQTEKMSDVHDMDPTAESYEIKVLPSASSNFLKGHVIPKCTINHFQDVLNLIKSLLPFGILGSQYRPLNSLISCYVDECCQVLKMMKSYLSVLMNDFPGKTTALVAFYAVTSCEDVIITLTHCSENISNDDVRAPFQGVCQSYADLAKTIKDLVIQNLCVRIRSSILQDGESNHFSDPKEFADGERCSYVLENWKRFMGRIFNDLDTSVSICTRNEIFSDIFKDSLLVIKQRYLHCKPSYNRTKQLKRDIPFIISTCDEYLHLNEQTLIPQFGLFSDITRQMITTSCEILKCIMTLVSGPLDVIYEQLQKQDFNLKSVKRDNVKDTAMINALKCTNNDQFSLVECLIVLLSYDSYLLNYVFSDAFKEKIGENDACDLHHSIFSVLCSGLRLWSDKFFKFVFLSVENDIKVLIGNCIHSSSDRTFSWQKAFFETLDRILCDSLLPAVSYLSNPCWSSMAQQLASTLPSGMRNAVCDILDGTGNAENTLNYSVLLILQGLTNSLFFFPDWLTDFFVKLDEHFDSETKTVNFRGRVSLYIIIKNAEKLLSSPNIWEQHCCIELTKEGVKAMKLASSKLVKLCLKDFKPSLESEEIQLEYMQKLSNELDESLDLSSEMDAKFEHTHEQVIQECTIEVEFLKQNNNAAYDSLKFIKNMLTQHFDHLEEYWLGKHQHNTGMHDGQINWDEMCTSAFLLLEWRTVRNLLSRRWEMAPGASLTDAQIRLVEGVLQVFNGISL